ncbi:MAG: NPCBM/NEW2 domain-containing protein, partial [Planctomycetota bacterium]
VTVLLETRDHAGIPREGDRNLFLANGDLLAGQVTGEGERLRFTSRAVRDLVVHLDEVSAVRFGRILGPTKTLYENAFRAMRRAGRDAVLVRRGERPLQLEARVTALRDRRLTVRVAGVEQTIRTDQVFAFVRNPEPADERPAEGPGVSVRLFLLEGGRVTVPLAGIDPHQVHGGGASIRRAQVARMEFRGPHLVYLSELNPIAVHEVAVLGPAPKWRRDRMVHGAPMRVASRALPRGLGVHAHSRLEFALGRRWSSFFVQCGIDDAAGPRGRAVFRLLGDGRVLAEVRRRQGQDPAALRLDVRDVDRLLLEADPDGSYTSDLCDWGQARLFSAPLFEPPPGGGG